MGDAFPTKSRHQWFLITSARGCKWHTQHKGTQNNGTLYHLLRQIRDPVHYWSWGKTKGGVVWMGGWVFFFSNAGRTSCSELLFHWLFSPCPRNKTETQLQNCNFNKTKDQTKNNSGGWYSSVSDMAVTVRLTTVLQINWSVSSLNHWCLISRSTSSAGVKNRFARQAESNRISTARQIWQIWKIFIISRACVFPKISQNTIVRLVKPSILSRYLLHFSFTANSAKWSFVSGYLEASTAEVSHSTKWHKNFLRLTTAETETKHFLLHSHTQLNPKSQN